MQRPSGYLGRYRRMLLDMHIADWDEGFLQHHDPKALVRCYELANVDAVMLYCKSHVGLCYWPTVVGKKHPGIEGDAVGDTVHLLHERDILVCAYVSVSFDHHAVLTHPEWSIVPSDTVWPRWSVACLNNEEYVSYEKAHYTELLDGYPFDAFFLDMAFWPGVCTCDPCRNRYRDEEGAEIPELIDWTSPDWARFQAARIRWTDEFVQQLIAHVRSLKDIPVYQNCAAFLGWQGAKPLHTFRNDSFFGSDLTGGRDEQLFAMKMMRASSPNLPAEYMTPRAQTLQDHVSIKSEAEMTLQALGSLAMGSAVLFIDAIDPDGHVDPDVYEQVGRISRRYEPFEHLIGGEHIEDIGVYYSSESQVALAESGSPIEGPITWERAHHPESAIGAIRCLQQEHLAAGVATYLQLDDLARYEVVVVPDLSLISEREAQAFRSYVSAGGQLYASGRTSLISTDGVRHEDFLLGDVFGVHYEGDEPGSEVFLRPSSDEVLRSIHPQKFVRWQVTGPDGPSRVRAGVGALVLGTLSLPYAYPAPGTHQDRDWASVYSMPPWTHTDHPILVENVFGDGRAIYSAFPLERDPLPAGRALFAWIMRRLLGDRATLTAEAHPAVWVEAFHQPDEQRFVVNLLNFATDFVPLPADVTFRLTLPDGSEAVRTATIDPFDSVTIEYAT